MTTTALQARANGKVAPPPRRRRWLWIALSALVLGVSYLGSGIFVVDTDEQAVIRRFGAISARVGPGIHYRLPWPVDRVDVLVTTSVMKAGVGFALPESAMHGRRGCLSACSTKDSCSGFHVSLRRLNASTPSVSTARRHCSALAEAGRASPKETVTG